MDPHSCSDQPAISQADKENKGRSVLPLPEHIISQEESAMMRHPKSSGRNLAPA